MKNLINTIDSAKLPPNKNAYRQAFSSGNEDSRYIPTKEAKILPRFHDAVIKLSTLPLNLDGISSSIAEWIAENSPPSPNPVINLKSNAISKELAKPVKNVPREYKSSVMKKFSFFRTCQLNNQK
jgi:hypothetical protein